MIDQKFIKFLGKLESVSSPADRATINTIRGKYTAMMEMGSAGVLGGLQTGVTRGANLGQHFGSTPSHFNQNSAQVAAKNATMQNANRKINQSLSMLNGCKAQLINKSGLDPVELEVWVKRELLPAIRYAAEHRKGVFDTDVYGNNEQSQIAGRARDHEKAVKERMAQERGNMNYYERAQDAEKNGNQQDRMNDVNERIANIQDSLKQLNGNTPEINEERKRLNSELNQLNAQKSQIGKRSMWGRVKSFFRGEAVDIIAKDPVLFESLCGCTDEELAAIAKQILI